MYFLFVVHVTICTVYTEAYPKNLANIPFYGGDMLGGAVA